MIELDVDSRDLQQVTRTLRGMENGKDLRKQLRKDITAAAKPMVPAIRSKVRALPSKEEEPRREGPGLRASIAKAARLQVQMSGRYAGVTIRVDPKKMPPGMHNLPAYMEGAPPFQRWRHPVYGNRKAYVTQRSHPYFYRIAEAAQPRIKAAVAEAIESIRRQLET